MGASRSCWNGATSALQPEEITSKIVCTINKSAHTKKSRKLFNDPRILGIESKYILNSKTFLVRSIQFLKCDKS